MGRLQGLRHDRHQVALQDVELHLVSQPGAEVLERPPRVVLAAVEAAVHQRLDAPPQRVE
jgi:hypothetical protein